MSLGSQWYQDEDGLLGALRGGPSAAPGAPKIAGYADLEELSRGGQGVVYLATQRSTRRRVAIKVLLAGSFASLRDRRRFEREIDVVASLRHPGIVRLYDCGLTSEQHPYYVMEYLDGVSLGDLLRPAVDEAPKPYGKIRTTVELLERVCTAVGYAHRNGVIHRDIKPSNICVDRNQEPHVLDFGLARSAGERYVVDDSGVPMSMTGEFMGSLPWASPEQASGNPAGIDMRTDVYSLGVLGYQLLTGHFPYAVTGPFRDVLSNILDAEPQSIRTLRPEIDDELATIINKCLSKDPERRYGTAADVARDLRHYLAGEPIEAKRDSAWYAITKRLRRYRRATWITSGFLALTLVAAIATTFQWQRALLAENQANQARSAEQAARGAAERKAQVAREVNAMLSRILATPVESGRDARVVDVLQPAIEELEAGSLDPEIEVPLRDTLGTAYASLGMLEEAAPLLEKAAAQARDIFGPTSDDALLVAAHVAWLRSLQGDYEESARLYREILATREEHFAADDPQTGVCINDLALVLESLGQYEEAEAMFRKSLAFVQRKGPDTQDAINGIGNLSSVLHAQGKYEQAEELALERLERATRVLGAEHRDTLVAQNNLAVLYNDLARYDEAVGLLRNVAQARQRILGLDHMDTLQAQQNLAYAVSELGAPEEATAIYREVLERGAARYGAEHPVIGHIRGNLASQLYATGHLDEARGLQEEVLRIWRAQLGDDHPDTLLAMNNLATTLLTQLDFEQGATLLAEVVERSGVQLGVDHPNTVAARLNYAAALREAGRYEQAWQVAQPAVAQRHKALGAAHPSTWVADWELVTNHLDSGRIEEALVGTRDLQKRAPEVFGEGHFYPIVLDGFYAKVLMMRGAFEEAEAILIDAAEGLREVLGSDHYVTQVQLARLAWLCEHLGRVDESEAYLAELSPRAREKLAHERKKFVVHNLPPAPQE